MRSTVLGGRQGVRQVPRGEYRRTFCKTEERLVSDLIRVEMISRMFVTSGRSCRLARLLLAIFLAGVYLPWSQAQGQAQKICGRETRCLLIEAQDLGMAASVNNASYVVLDRSNATAGGVLVPTPWFPDIVRWARIHHLVDLGVEIDLNAEWSSYRWRPVSPQSKASGLVDPTGYLPNDARFIGLHAKPEEVSVEIRAQIQAARMAGLTITHLDSHGGIAFFTPWLFKAYWKASEDAGLPAVISKEWVMQHGRLTGKHDIYEVGGVDVDLTKVPFDRIIQMQPGIAKDNWLTEYETMLGGLPVGVYLLKVHIGFNDEELQRMTVGHPNWGAQWRQNDYDVISSPEFQKFLRDQGFILVNWMDLQKALQTKH